MSKFESIANADREELLTTKLAPPRLQSSIISRQPLLDRLDEGLDQKLTLVSAPAGFGKTTLVTAWLAARCNGSDTPTVAWVSLDAGDNDPVRFWRYLLTACQTFRTDLGLSALALLHMPQPPFETILTAFINEVARLPGRYVLILEDYHFITSPQIHESLTFLIDHLPPTLHVTLLSRTDPPLPLARLRARNHLNEFRAADLRFSPAEIQVFLEETLPFSLSPEAIAHLTTSTEGWIAGLRLAALALRERQTPQQIEQFLASFNGSHGHILEYLVEEVLDAQPEPIRIFLLETTFLSRLNASLCEAVTGRADSANLLEQIERANLFLIPLDRTGQWYRYHALFAEAMQHYARRRLGETRLRELFYQASLWYEQHDLLAEAIEAALSSREFMRAAGLIERIIAPRLPQNEYHTLRRWIGQLPEDILRAYPPLGMIYAVAILFTSDRHAPATEALIQTPLQIAEAHWRAGGNQPKLGELLAFRSLVAWLQKNFQQSFTIAKEALTLLPEDERQWRGISLIFVGVEALWAGKLIAARQTLTEARALCEAAENIYGTLDTMLLLGDLYTRQGEMHQAAQLYRQVLAKLEHAPLDRNQMLIRRGRALLGLGELALEWNNLESAEQDLSEAVAISEQFPEEDLPERSPLILARLKNARGETAQAQQLLQRFIARIRYPQLLREAQAVQAWLALIAGDLAAARHWSAVTPPPGDDIPRIQQEQEALILARLHLARGQAGSALRLLEDWQTEAHVEGRVRTELEINILTALAYAALGDLSRARQTLLQVLTLAQPEDYRRLFLDEGGRVAILLQTILSDLNNEPLAVYIRSLLLAFGQEQPNQNTVSSPSPLIEPLSPQEERVLRLLASGLSNPEIAEELVVSINTIKTQVKSIYRKLDVHSRDEAAAMAHRLKLI